jgi:hypothetical protein
MTNRCRKMAGTPSFFDTLVGLSDNILYDDKRNEFLEKLSDTGLNDLIIDCLMCGVDRENREHVAIYLLDFIAKLGTRDASEEDDEDDDLNPGRGPSE